MRRFLIISVCMVALGATAFGATLNVPKEYDTIQDAVDNAKNGDVIKVKKGTYRETVEIALLEDVTLKAAGKVVIDGENTRDTLRIGLVENVQVIGISVTNSRGHGIYVAGAESVTLKDCRISDTGDVGIYATSCRNLVVTGCRIEDTNVFGFHVEDESGAPASLACVVEKCRFTDTGDFGIYFEHGSAHRAEKNRIDSPGGDGIYVMAPGSTCAKNRINRPRGDGITVHTNDAIVEKNVVKDPTSQGIYIFGDGAVVTKNQVTTPHNSGFRVRGTDNRLEKNQVKSGHETGFWLQEGGNSLIRNKAKKCEVAVDDDFADDNEYEKNNFDPPT